MAEEPEWVGIELNDYTIRIRVARGGGGGEILEIISLQDFHKEVDQSDFKFLSRLLNLWE